MKQRRRIKFICPACKRFYRKRVKYFDARRRCPLCKAVAVPTLMQPKRDWMRSVCTRPQGHAPEERWTPATWDLKYRAYLRSEFWQERREEALDRDAHICRSCEAATAKHVHHITYQHFGSEPQADLVSLCRMCHEYEHQTYTLRSRERHWRNQNELLEAAVGRSQVRPSSSKGSRIEAQQDTPTRNESQEGAAGSDAAAAIS